MQNGEFRLIDFVKNERWMVYLPEALDDICIFELRKSHVVYN